MRSGEQSTWPVGVKDYFPHTILAFLITESASLQSPPLRAFQRRSSLQETEMR